ncbi:MAG TPA: thioredoxin domain-containing protein [Terriglobales bacterium]|nr:thioredoxin domain-containing protein [Terriglobales bacterium]
MTTDTVNSLAQASSAYLRTAMHQPIRWQQWGPEAFAAAQKEDKPILLDIGAVWCHWCHVMDRESYDNSEVAAIINEHFIAIKVDRDERPDVDSRYQAAVSAISGQGGWPLTAFLTSDGKPFYGGTYFPPDDQWGRPGFKRVLLAIAGAYREKRAEVTEQASMVGNLLAQSEAFATPAAEFSPRVIDAVVAAAVKMFDPEHGGFGNAPKFPHPSIIDLLIEQYARTGNEELKNIFVTTLQRMANGGVYDQLAGGFHRYSVDERWIVPHFEKMSYDNSELLKNYVHAAQVTGDPFFAQVARDIIRWMDEWLSDREHAGFYASQDADYSLDDDGDYFTWTLPEAAAVLREDELKVAQLHYDINEVGEMHHNPAKNVLYVRAPLEQIAVRLGTSPERVQALLASAREKLYAARLQRPTPFVDKTLYVSWNALCISAYLEAARALRLEDARHFALRSLDRILSEGWSADHGLQHVITYSESGAEKAPLAGMLDDYAFTALACLDAYETTSDLSYFHFAQRIIDRMIASFFDDATGGFFDTYLPGTGQDALGVLNTRRKPFQDSPTPSGNSAAIRALLRLYSYTNNRTYREKAENTIRLFAGVAEQYGMFAATYAIAAVMFSKPEMQVVVIGSGSAAEELYRAAVAPFSFSKSVLKFSENEITPPNLPPALADTLPSLPRGSEAIAVICSGMSCRAPITDPQELARALRTSLS